MTKRDTFVFFGAVLLCIQAALAADPYDRHVIKKGETVRQIVLALTGSANFRRDGIEVVNNSGTVVARENFDTVHPGWEVRIRSDLVKKKPPPPGQFPFWPIPSFLLAVAVPSWVVVRRRRRRDRDRAEQARLAGIRQTQLVDIQSAMESEAAWFEVAFNKGLNRSANRVKMEWSYNPLSKGFRAAIIREDGNYPDLNGHRANLDYDLKKIGKAAEEQGRNFTIGAPFELPNGVGGVGVQFIYVGGGL
jgi:hypothetical protein